MKPKEDTWGWMLAVDFFFAGMGGGMLLIAGVMELFLGEGRTSILGNFAGALFIAIGASFLILELGRPLHAWRVFLNPKAILTIGAWNMLLAIGAGLIYASFDITALPWSGWIAVRKIFALGCVIFGLIVATYPGILLGGHKSRPFWTGPGMMIVFLVSSLVTGAAAHLFLGLILPPSQLEVMNALPKLIAGLLGFQLLVWAGYMWVKRSGTTQREALAVQRWINGDLASTFWGGIIFIGSALPLILVLLPVAFFQGGAAFLVLVGGLLLRLTVVRSGEDRTWLPGEEKYRSRLPLGDEAFLNAWKSK